jgi:hypothetical protein
MDNDRGGGGKCVDQGPLVNLIVAELVKEIPHFLEPECSLSCLQGPPISPCAEPQESNHPALFP